MYDKIFKTDVIVFFGDVTLSDYFQYQSQFVNNYNIAEREQRKNDQITDRKLYVL